MKRFLRIGATVIGLALVVGIFSVTETRSQVLNEILTRMDKHNKSLSSLKSGLKMVKVNKQLNEADTYQGTLTMLPKKENRPMYARIDWAKPRVENLAVIGESFEFYNSGSNTRTTGKTSSAGKGNPGGALGFLTMSKAQLKDNYNIDYMGQESIAGSVDAWHLRLTPKSPNGSKFSDIWVDSNGMPLQATVTENNNDTTTIVLSGLKKNEKVDASVFKLKVPKGAKTVKG